jgi:LmbE family N-acetylglucosaminyl deacetylase
LVREIRRFRPEVIVTGDPTVVFSSADYLNHPDHRAASLAALEATFPAAGQPNLFEELAEEGLSAHKPRRVYVNVWDNKADVFVNIEDTIDTKIEALRAHKSQMGEWDPTAMIKEWAASSAQGKEMAYAEAYRVVTLVDDKTWEELKHKNGKVDETVPAGEIPPVG